MQYFRATGSCLSGPPTSCLLPESANLELTTKGCNPQGGSLPRSHNCVEVCQELGGRFTGDFSQTTTQGFSLDGILEFFLNNRIINLGIQIGNENTCNCTTN